MKDVTKDIDLIVASRKEFFELQNKLRELGFETKIPGKEYSRMNLSQIFERESLRIDIFEKEVCGRFALSKNMIKRSERVLSLKK